MLLSELQEHLYFEAKSSTLYIASSILGEFNPIEISTRAFFSMPVAMVTQE